MVAVHPYAAEGRSARTVYAALGVAAVLSAWALHKAASVTSLALPWWIETPSVLGFLGLYWKWFDLRLWRLPILQQKGWLGVPDFRGTWMAHLRTSHDGGPRELEGELCIEQTWSKLSVLGVWPHSESHSVSAVLQRGPGTKYELVYTYVNEPRSDALPTMHMHRGTAWLRLDAVGDVMDGHYYSGRGRQEHGDLEVRRAARS